MDRENTSWQPPPSPAEETHILGNRAEAPPNNNYTPLTTRLLHESCEPLALLGIYIAIRECHEEATAQIILLGHQQTQRLGRRRIRELGLEAIRIHIYILFSYIVPPAYTVSVKAHTNGMDLMLEGTRFQQEMSLLLHLILTSLSAFYTQSFLCDSTLLPRQTTLWCPTRQRKTYECIWQQKIPFTRSKLNTSLLCTYLTEHELQLN